MSGSGNKRRSLHDMCSSGSRKKKIIECTHERQTLLTYKAGRYCQQCYDNQPSQLSSAEKKRSSALGKPLHAIKSFKSNYPERMKRVFMCNPPSYFSVFWALAKPFIDPVTRDKVVSCYG